MPFGVISTNAKTFDPRQPGVYSLTGLSFDQPINELRVRGGTQSKTGISTSVTRVLAKDVTIGSDVVRKSATVTLQIVIPSGPGYTATELDELVKDIDGFISATNVSRLLQGES